MLQVPGLTLGDRPRIAVPLRDDLPGGTEDDLVQAGADMLELRIDQFTQHDTAYVLDQAQRWKRLPILATIRRREESGAWPGTEHERLALYEALLPQVAAVDIELHAHQIRDELQSAAKAAGKWCILSHHNFERTPEDTALDDCVTAGIAAGADVVKIAAHCTDRRDLQRLAGLLLRRQDIPLIVIGMGPQSALSRIFFPALGSLITYAAWDTPSAPGQLSLQETRALLDRFYPAPR